MIKPFKYNVGLFINDFNPLDIFNLNIIYKAASDCNELFIILKYDKDNDLIDYRLRYQWIFNLTSHFDNVTIIPLENNNLSLDNVIIPLENNNLSLSLNSYFNYVFEKFDKKLDVIYLNNQFSSNINLDLDLDDVYIIENEVSISSSDIHNNPFKYWDYIPNIVKEYYVKKVLIIGNESTGKSVLTQSLANLYNTNCVLEYSRDVCSRCGGEDYMVTEDFEEVLYQHKLNIQKGLKDANKLLFIDTDSFMTYYYRKHAGLIDTDIKDSILDNEDNIRLISRDYDLVLFMESDVPYVQDDLRIIDRNENGLREECSETIKQIYKDNGVDFKIISGSYRERLEKAQYLIKEKFGI